MYLAMSDSQSRINNFKTLGPGSTKISRTHEYTLPISQLNPHPPLGLVLTLISGRKFLET